MRQWRQCALKTNKSFAIAIVGKKNFPPRTPSIRLNEVYEAGLFELVLA